MTEALSTLALAKASDADFPSGGLLVGAPVMVGLPDAFEIGAEGDIPLPSIEF